jgi:hypothetical protein
MSITFSGSESAFEDKEVPCGCVEDGTDPSCYFCNGTGIDVVRVYEIPELNMCNANAYSIMRILGLGQEACGTIELKEIPSMRRKILHILNDEIMAQIGIRPEENSQRTVVRDVDGIPTIGKGCRVIDAGFTLDQITERLLRLDATLTKAQQLGRDVNWF